MFLKKSILEKLIVLIIFLIPLHFANAKNKVYSSGEKKVSLIELYSSEGCSSCPPADRWFSGLLKNKDLWSKFVPIAFHVDYWNRLGWVDAYATKSFTKRQHRYASQWKKNKVYTPGFVKNGQEWRQRQMNSWPSDLVGELKVTKVGEETFEVSFKPTKSLKHLEINGSLMGHGLSTDVKYGENAGEVLKHDFIVLKQVKTKLSKKAGEWRAKLVLPSDKKTKSKRYSVAFWVSVNGNQTPIQAVGGFL